MIYGVETKVVYVIGAAENPIKIGLARSVSARLAELQCGNPDPLTCHYFARVPADRALFVEQAAHSAFAEHRRLGEWFNVHWKEAAALIQDLAAVEAENARNPSVLSILRTEYGMKAEGASAVWDYLDKLDKGHDYVPHANGYILKKRGTAAYAAFSLVIAQQKPLSGLSRDETERAFKVLADAINTLCNFRLHYRAQELDRAMQREMAALRRA